MNESKKHQILSSFEKKEYNKISDSLDYFIALLWENNPDADLLTIQQFVELIDTQFHYKYWKKNETERQMNRIFSEMYEMIDPIKNNFPKLKENYEDLVINESTSIDSSGDTQICQSEPTEKDFKKYIVSILDQSANYSKSSNKNQVMNRDFLNDLKKIISLPRFRQVLNNAVLQLQPYIYDKDLLKCNNCGYCGICRQQKFDTEKPYYKDLKAQLNRLCERMSYFEQITKGEKGDGFDLEAEWPLKLTERIID